MTKAKYSIWNCAGISLMELLIALSLSAILFSLVFYSWNFVNSHTFQKDKQFLFQDENMRIAEEIAMAVRRSPQVLHYGHNSIALICALTDDTVRYHFDGTRLLKNSNEIFNRSGSQTEAFILKESGSYDETRSRLLEIVLASKTKNGATDTVRLTVRAKIDSEELPVMDNWNF